MKPERPIRIDLERFLPYRLSVLTNVVSSAIAGVYQQRFGLSTPEWRVLAVLARHPGLAAAEVAALTRMDAVAVSRAVTRLLSSGRLRRSMSPHDRRRSVLQVSPDGAALYHEVAPLALRFERDLLAALRPAERDLLDAALAKLMSRAESLAALPGRAAGSRGRAQPRRARWRGKPR